MSSKGGWFWTAYAQFQYGHTPDYSNWYDLGTPRSPFGASCWGFTRRQAERGARRIIGWDKAQREREDKRMKRDRDTQKITPFATTPNQTEPSTPKDKS